MILQILSVVIKELGNFFIRPKSTYGYRQKQKSLRYYHKRKKAAKRNKRFAQRRNFANKKNVKAYQNLMLSSKNRAKKAKRARRTWKLYRKYKAQNSNSLF